MATLSVQQSVRAGLTLARASAAGGGDKFLNTGKEALIIKNGDSGSHTVTIVSQSTMDGLAVADRAVAVAAGAEKVIGPFQPNVYNDDDGFVQLTYDGVTSVTVAVVKIV